MSDQSKGVYFIYRVLVNIYAIFTISGWEMEKNHNLVFVLEILVFLPESFDKKLRAPWWRRSGDARHTPAVFL